MSWSSIPPKLLWDVLLDDLHGVDALLIFGRGFHGVVLFEVRDVFGVSEVFFSGI